LAIDAAGEYSAHSNYEHVVITGNEPPRGFWELQNRRTVHAWLLQAQEWNTEHLEQQAASCLRARPLRFSELARDLMLSDVQARLVFVRCWLGGCVEWDIGAENIACDLRVGGPHV
jgi:hypothetical protein